jgi:hypothetical protein
MVFVLECLSGKAERGIDLCSVDFERGEREKHTVAVVVFWQARNHIFEDLKRGKVLKCLYSSTERQTTYTCPCLLLVYRAKMIFPERYI